MTFATPVAIVANTTYVASYHAPNGNYAIDTVYFTADYVNSPLRVPANGGVFRYGASGTFPNQAFRSSNYWVDVVIAAEAGPDQTPPSVVSAAPASQANGVDIGVNVTATFSEAMASATIGGSTFTLKDAAGNPVPAAVTYDATTRTATLDPTAPLARTTRYTATISGVTDTSGNALTNSTWSFTTAAPPGPPPDEGPGGPILVVTDASDRFGRYYAEILRTEGLNAFATTDITKVDAVTLGQYQVVILARMQLSSGQVGLFTDWVNAGGNLIAMRPGPELAGLLGLSNLPSTLANAYLKVNTSSAPGQGLVTETIQFHDVADLYALNGASAVAPLYSDATTATSAPAVTLRSVGSNGGQAAAFTFDLARSIVYTRQGNPAWAGQERDGTNPIRSDDLFFGGLEADWVDLNKVAIPQADEQQRLLANHIGHMNSDLMPLPRFWYFPRGEKAVVIMTGDDHGNGGTAGQFDSFMSVTPAGASVEDWEAVRATSYIYPSTPLSPGQAAAYLAAGFEVALHVNTDLANFTPSSLEEDYAEQLAAWGAKYAGLPAPATNRTHTIVWSDWATQPKVELAHGIRLDTNYYYWPESWIQDRPGLFTGSGMPMRFADLDGMMIDVYQAATQMTDESGQEYPFTIDALLDRALGPEGYYGAFTANMPGGDDSNDINPGGGAGKIKFAINGVSQVVSSQTTRLIVNGQDGNDQIQVPGGITLSTLIDGGAGNDEINGGNGSNILLGGDGDDTLTGGNQADILIGGRGADRIHGNTQDDLLIGGTTAYDLDPEALRVLMEEWLSPDGYETRVGRIRNGFLRRSRLIKLDGQVVDDLAVDLLTGSSGRDLFFTGMGDSTPGRGSNELDG